MNKMSINDAAEYFGVSKEAIHNRIRRGSLKSIVENGIKLVAIDSNAPKKASNRSSGSKTVLNDDRYYKLLEEQNIKLQSRVEVLETETRSLRDQKELMLIEERVKIENIYKEKDEQLKNILSSISSQFMLGNTSQAQEEDEHLEAEIEVEEIEVKQEEQKNQNSKLISLKKYLKKLDLSDKKQVKIIKKFHKREDEERVIIKKDKYYLDTVNFSYEDLI